MFRPSLVRYAGLTGSLFLAVAAHLGGARSPWQPTMTPRTILAGRDGVLLPLSWLLGVLLLTGAWWVGRRVVPSARWAYLTAAIWALPLLLFLPLGSYDVYSYACQGWQQAAGLDPYAGGVNQVGCPWADAVAPTWRDSPTPYGPLFLLLAAAAAKLGGSLAGTVVALRVIAVLGVLAIAACLPALCRAASASGQRGEVPLSRVVWLTLACPIVPIHLISGAHNDAVMVALLVAALVVAVPALERGGPDAGRTPYERTWWLRAAAAGALVGLAAAVKVTALVVVPFVALLVVGRRWRATALTAAAALVMLGAVTVAAGRGLGWLGGLAAGEVSVQWTSPPTAIGMTLASAGVPGALRGARLLGMVVLVAVLVVLWWRARRGDAMRYAGFALAATVLLAPLFHPWYAMWALPVLAVTVDRDTRWLVVPYAVASVLCLPDGYNLALASKTQGAALMTVLVVVLCVRLATGRRALHHSGTA